AELAAYPLELSGHPRHHLAVDEALVDPTEVVVRHETVETLARAQGGRSGFGSQGGSTLQLPGTLGERLAVHQLDHAVGVGDEQLDVVVVLDAPDARLAAQQLADLRLARSLSASLVAFHLGALLGGRDDLPGAGLEAQAVLAIVEDAQLLAEGELLLARVRSLALAAPHADQRQERE